MKKYLSIVSLIVMFFWSTFSNASGVCPEGGSCGGGGNMIEGKMIEDYYHDTKDLKGYSIYEKKMALLDKSAPLFAKLLRESVDRMGWYIVPIELASVPNSKVQLPFKSEQGIGQTEIEIFINENAYKNAKDTTMAKALMHEAIMSLLKDKKSGNVRLIVNKIFEKDATAASIQDALVNYKFGAYFSYEQMDMQTKEHLREVNSKLSDALTKAELNCKNEMPLKELLVQISYDAIGYLNGNSAGSFVKRVSIWDSYPDKNKHYPDSLILSTCNKNEEKLQRIGVCDEFYRFVNYNGITNDTNSELRNHSIMQALIEISQKNASDRVLLLTNMRNRNDFLNILAINSNKDFDAGNSEIDIDCSPHSVLACMRESLEAAKKLEEKVLKKKEQINSFEEEAKKKLFCNSVSSLKKYLPKISSPIVKASTDNTSFFNDNFINYTQSTEPAGSAGASAAK